LIAAFVVLAASILSEDVMELIGPAFLALMGVCFALGLALLVLSVRWRVSSVLRTLWIVTGAAPMGLAVGSVLHNVFYAVGMVTGAQPILHGAAQVLEVAFFLFGVLVCPVAFIGGAIGAIVTLARQRQGHAAA
jgi:hypothetical protein